MVKGVIDLPNTELLSLTYSYNVIQAATSSV